MTKSQNTKNEQQKDWWITSEQLTEKWKKGELPNGWYWVKGIKSEGIYAYTAEYLNNMYRPINGEIIIEQVPSYEEWQASEKYNKHLEEVIKTYERKDKQATETSIAYNELAKENEELKEILERHKKATAKAQIRSCDLEIINTHLKELLKECIPYFNALVEKRLKLEYIPQVYELLTKINEVLK